MCWRCGGLGYIRIVTWTQYDTSSSTPPPNAPAQIVPCVCRSWLQFW